MKRCTLLLASAVLLVLLLPPTANASTYSMVYHPSSGVYDGSAAGIIPYWTSSMANNSATIKGALYTDGYKNEIGWSWYPGWASPRVFYYTYDRQTDQSTAFYYAYTSWNVSNGYRIQGDVVTGFPWVDWVYDYYWNGNLIASTPSNLDWDEQRFYAGGARSQNSDRMKALFTYYSYIPNFSLHINGSGEPGSFF